LGAKGSIFQLLISLWRTRPIFTSCASRVAAFYKARSAQAEVLDAPMSMRFTCGWSIVSGMNAEVAWKTPLFHPMSRERRGLFRRLWNALGAELSLDELCGMLWDMIRYENYDETSPYNREAAAWAKNRLKFSFPNRRPAATRQASQVEVN